MIIFRKYTRYFKIMQFNTVILLYYTNKYFFSPSTLHFNLKKKNTKYPLILKVKKNYFLNKKFRLLTPTPISTQPHCHPPHSYPSSGPPLSLRSYRSYLSSLLSKSNVDAWWQWRENRRVGITLGLRFSVNAHVLNVGDL